MLAWCDWIETEAGRPAGEAWQGLVSRVRAALTQETPAHAVIQPFLDPLVRGDGQVAAVLFYGSCLFSRTNTRTSFPDFYVLVDDLDRYHTSRWHAVINRVLPPNVYYADLKGEPAPCSQGGVFFGGGRFKFCVMSMAQFVAETSDRARDIHHLGRFSKRIALAWSRDEQAESTVVRGNLSAMLTLVPHALTLLPRSFTLEQFILQQLGLSYLGEQRVAEPDKVRGLMEGALEFYRDVYSGVLELHALRCGGPRRASSGDRYEQPAPGPAHVRRTQAFLKRSRLRGVLRWPKYILTVDNWVDYLLEKLERHHGVHIELTERQRRYPLIFGWPVYFEMRRRGIVK